MIYKAIYALKSSFKYTLIKLGIHATNYSVNPSIWVFIQLIL